MTVAIGLGIILALGAAYPTVRRRHVRLRTVRHVRAALAPWLTSDMAAPLRPVIDSPNAMTGPTPQGPGDSPDLLVPAVRRQHFELTPNEITGYRRAS